MTYVKQRQGIAPFRVARFGEGREAWAILRSGESNAYSRYCSEYFELFADEDCQSRIGVAPTIFEVRKAGRRFFNPEFHLMHPLLRYVVDLWDELLCINYLPFWQAVGLLLTFAFLLAFAGVVIILPTVLAAVWMFKAPTVVGKLLCLAMALSWPMIIGLTMRRRGGMVDRFCERATQVLENPTVDRWAGGSLIVALAGAIIYSYLG